MGAGTLPNRLLLEKIVDLFDLWNMFKYPS
jgi:hypothetical protein